MQERGSSRAQIGTENGRALGDRNLSDSRADDDTGYRDARGINEAFRCPEPSHHSFSRDVLRRASPFRCRTGATKRTARPSASAISLPCSASPIACLAIRQHKDANAIQKASPPSQSRPIPVLRYARHCPRTRTGDPTPLRGPVLRQAQSLLSLPRPN